MSKPKLDKSKLNVARIFLIYTSFVGDVEKTAAALNLNPEVVQQLAEEEGWLDTIKRVSTLSKTGKPGDWERAQNRALNFVQAHRLRVLLDRAMDNFDDCSPEELLEEIATVGKGGMKTLSIRFFADMSAAMEKVHQLTYSAIGDTVGERDDAGGEEGPTKVSALHMAVLEALNNPSIKRIPAGVLVQEVEARVIATVKDPVCEPEATTPL